MSLTLGGNYLLDASPEQEYSRLAPHLKAITTNTGDVLHQEDKSIKHALKRVAAPRNATA